MHAPLLSIEDLHTYFYSRPKQAFIRSVDGVSLEVAEKETLGIVGESGSGKSVTALSIMGLVAGVPGVISGRITVATNGEYRNLLQDLDRFVSVTKKDGRIMDVRKDAAGWEQRSEGLMKGVRGREIAMIFQNPKSSLNPFVTVGRQITEAILLHTGIKNKQDARERAIFWLDRVRIDSPRLRFDDHPYGLSGGMCQRVMIAMALACEPKVLIADEPTTGLDATIQSKIVDLLAELKAALGTTTMLISHDIGTIARLSDRVAVMYGGTVVEFGPARHILAADCASKHPYASALLASVPSRQCIEKDGRLQAIEGDVLDTINMPAGCRFFSRCGRVNPAIRKKCEGLEPDLREVAPGHKVRCWLYFD